MTRAAIALGSNLGDREAALGGAATRLARHLGDVRLSDFINTEPEGVCDQPTFLNAAMVGDWDGEARDLLALLLDIERSAGRVRPYAGAPRTLDLDLVLFGSAVLHEPGLVVPHPRFRHRAFVLAPLAQIAPDLVDPVSGQTVAALLRAIREG